MKSSIFKNSKLDFIELRYVKDIENCVKMHLHEELTITAIKKGSLKLIFNDTSCELKPDDNKFTKYARSLYAKCLC